MRKSVFLRVLAAFAVTVSLACAASADIVYTTADYTSGSGALGLIIIGRDGSVDIRPNVRTNLPSDTYLASFKETGSPRIALIEHNYDIDDTAAIYDPRSDWEKPLFNLGLDGSVNTHGLAASDNKYTNSIFTASYENASITEYSTSDYKPVGRSYVYEAEEGYTPHAEKVLVHRGAICALFTSHKGSWGSYVYAPSRLMVLDGHLDNEHAYDSSDIIGANAVDMAKVNNDLIAIAYWGGRQGYGTHGGVDLYNIRSHTVTQIVSGDEYGGIVAVCGSRNDRLFFLEEKYPSEDTKWEDTVKTLYRWDRADNNSGTVTKLRELPSKSGACRAIVWDDSAKLLAVTTGDRIFLIDDESGEIREEISSTELRGDICSMVSTSSVTPGSNSDSGGGCNAAGLGLAALALIPILSRSAKRR